MKLRSRISSVSTFVVSTLFCAAAYAGVCFVIGDCGQNVVVSKCGADYNGYQNQTCQKGYSLGGKSCVYDGIAKYEFCKCDMSYYRWEISDAEKYDYVEKINSSDDKTSYCSTSRAHAKYCKAKFKYAKDLDIDVSWNSPQVKPSVCEGIMVPDPDSDSCEEIDSIKVGGSSYKKYTACKCPDLAEGKTWKTCDKPHQLGVGDECEGKYTECRCDYGYTLDSTYGCVENKPSSNFTHEDFVAQCSNPYGIAYKNNDLSRCTIRSENPKWKLYYTSSNRVDEINGLACMFMESNPDNDIEIEVIPSEHTEEVINTMAAAGEFAHIYEVNMHPLFSSLYAVGQADWGFDLGVAERPTPYITGENYEEDGYNFPLLMYGVLHTAGAYDMYCNTEDNMNDDPREYGYYGWMGGINEWINSIDEPIASGGSAEEKVIDPVKALMFRPYSYSRSCHPADFEAYDRYGCKDEDCSILNTADDEYIHEFGGDKCLNFVFNLNASDLALPVLVVDLENNVAYRINSEPRYRIEYEGLSWEGQIVTDKEGNNEYTDYAGNFITWKLDDEDSYGTSGMCGKVCYDRQTEYHDVEGKYINTYPYLNRYWIEKVATEEVPHDEGLNFLSDAKSEDTGSKINPTFIGGEGYADVKYYGRGAEDYSYDFVLRKYFNNNMENILNGVFGISSPSEAFRDEGAEADSKY